MQVLMIENVEADFLIVSRFLVGINDFSIKWCDSLAQGIDYLVTNSVDVLLLDMAFGLTNLDMIQARFPVLPIIILSADNIDELALQAVRHGAQDYLVKETLHGPMLRRVLHYAVERKRLEEQLRRSEHLYRTFAYNFPNGALLLYNHDLRYTLVDGLGLSELGLSKEKMEGKTIWEVFPAELATSGAVRMRTALAGNLHSEEIVFAGNTILMNYVPIRDETGTIISGMIMSQNITQRKRMEEELRRSEAEFRSAFNYAAIGKAWVALDGHWLKVNQALTHMIGYSEQELIGRTFQDLTHPDDLDADLDYVQQLLAGEIETYQMEKRYFHKDGHLVWGLLSVSLVRDAQGQPLHFISQIQNITKRKQAELELAAERNLLRTLIDTIPDHIFLKDTQSRFVMGNKAVMDAGGVTSMEQLAGKNDFDFLEPVFAQPFYDDEQKIFASGQTLIDREEASIDLKTGQPLWFLTTKVPLHDENGVITGLLGISRNITERKRTEALLNAQMDEERAFQNHLKALHEITIELTNENDLDTFYKRAVELGRQRLDFDRLGLLLYNQHDGTAIGTYGTDDQGKLVDEHHLHFDPSNLTSILLRALEKEERFAVDENAQLFSNFELIGTGWNAAAVLWNGVEKLGWLATDNGVMHLPMTQSQLNILALYALTLGTLLAQKRTQAAVQSSETRLQLLARNSPDIIYIVDISQGKVAYLNRTEFFGYSINEIESLGSHVTYIYPQDKDAVVEHWRNLIRNAQINQISQLEYRLLTKAGQLRWVQARQSIISIGSDGKPVQVLVTLTDITDRKQAEENLIQERDLLRTLIDNTPDYIFIKDIKGRFILSNRSHAQAAGAVPEAMVGKTAFDMFPHEFATQFHADDEQVLQFGEPLINLERQTLGIHKKPKTVLTTKIPLRDNEGRVTSLIGISRDITERKQLEAQALELVAERGRIKALQRFMTDMSHDFRTPLSIINTSLYLIMKINDPQKQEYQVRKAEQQILRMDKLLDELLQMQNLDEKDPTFDLSLTEINAYLTPVIQEYTPIAADKQITFAFVYETDPCFARIDVHQFVNVLKKLLDNAILYTHVGGSITVQTKTQNNQLIIAVRDTGIGISTTDLPHIFERFYRADEARSTQTGGNGLGLAIVQKIVEGHKGTVEVESILGQGSTFFVKIPLG